VRRAARLHDTAELCRPDQGERRERPDESGCMQPSRPARCSRAVALKSVSAEGCLRAGISRAGGGRAPSTPGSLKTSPYWIPGSGSMPDSSDHGGYRQGRTWPGFQDRLPARLRRRSLTSLASEGRHRRTKLTANEGYTSGSLSMQDQRHADSNAGRKHARCWFAEAAKRLDLAGRRSEDENGVGDRADWRRLSSGEMLASDMLHVQAKAKSTLKDGELFRDHGPGRARVDYPGQGSSGRGICCRHAVGRALVTARIVRPPGYGAGNFRVRASSVEKM